jgi:6-phosphofructokinase 1
MVAGRTSANYFVVKDEDIKDIMLKAKLIVDSGVESPLIIVKEHLYDVEQLADALTNYTKKPFKSTVLGYIQRGGIPTDFDINLAQLFVERLIKLIEAKKFNRAVGVDDGKILDIALEKASKVKKSE